MLKISLLSLLLLLTFNINLSAQETIPFKLTKHHNIIVKALINDKDSINLMFQIAMEEASLAPDRITKVESVKFDTTEYSEGLSRANSIKVANTIVDSLWIWDNEYTGYEAEGKIGTLLFNGKIFKIDYDQSQFVIYNDLPNVKDYFRIPLKRSQGGQLFVQANSFISGNPLLSEFLLQSGFSGAILYPNDFSDQYQLADKLPVLEKKNMKNSAGKTLTTIQCQLPEFRISQFSLKNIPVGLFTGEIKNQKVGYMGADILHRFNWIIDIKAGFAYIQKSKYFNEVYYFNNRS